MGYFSIYINGLINRPRNNIEEIQKFQPEIPNQEFQSDNPQSGKNKTSETDTSNFKYIVFIIIIIVIVVIRRRRRRRQPQIRRLGIRKIINCFF
jgi:hypothetical protein